ncbi:Uncharacterised protein [Cutibacterium granulosum]|uniref:Uncharacterized protein n=2 Tax=Cutibacterium granulosum TaxID=33011 RepID=A0A239WWG4_9ACTN|nr:hypothetical protein [Cutibacterium granulosum]SNV38158.1 Uncharacterised protein [Cutibacterium granulosum]
MAITELSDNELLVPHVPALRRDLMLEGDVTGHPVHPLLRPLFPGGLRSEAYSLDGASDVGLGLLVNGWCGVVGMPELRGAQVRRWGVDASRLVMVSSSRGWLATVAALVEELDVIYACAPPAMSLEASRRLATRLRARQSTLVICGEWSSAVTHIDVRTIGWRKSQQAGHSSTIHEVEVSVTRHHWSRSVVLARDDRGVHGISSELVGGIPS